MEIRLADRSNFTESSMDGFDRFQVVTNTYRMENGELKLQHHPFTEDWPPERRREKAAEILSGRFLTCCAWEDGRVVGELMLLPELNEGRMIVDSFHVSRECRRRGVGRALFMAASAEAARRGAHALYISACSAEETIDFYLAMGCRPSERPIPAYAAAEPFDIQMECALRTDGSAEGKANVNYRILDGAENMELNDIVRLLRMTCWADKRPVEQIEKSVRNTSCYGVFLEDERKLVGFARVISDYATTYYLCDVIIDKAYQHRGLGTALVSYIESRPEYAGLRGILITRDAHALYRKFGYEVLNDRTMVKGLNC